MSILLALAPLLFILPGLAWLVSIDLRANDLASILADLIGISIAMTAFAGLLTYFFDFIFPGWVIVVLLELILVYIIIRLFIRKPFRLLSNQPSPQPTNQSKFLPEFIPLLIFLAILLFRFYQARDLVLPAWVDSVHHSLLVRLILENSGIPESFVPYMPVPVYYHFGFHVNAALFAFLSQLSIPQAVLWMGQILNAVVALAMYRLTMSLWADWRRGALVMLLVGFVTQMPAYFVTWGRYTLLTGVILLALAMAVIIDLDRKGATPGRVATLVLFTVGTILSHYFAAVLLAMFALILVVERTLFGPSLLTRLLKTDSRKIILFASALAGIITAPWIFRVISFSRGTIGVNVTGLANTPDDSYFSGYLDYLWFLLGPDRSRILIGVGIAAIFVALRWKESRALSGWAVVFFGLSLPWGVHLDPFRPDHGVILAFFPAAIFLSDILIRGVDRVPKRFALLGRGVLALGITPLLWWGVGETRTILNPVTILASEADLAALDWVAENTPENAVFFTNVTLWQGVTYRGVDGGWWIMPVTGRQTLLPPALYPDGDFDYVLGVNALCRRASQLTTCNAEFWDLIDETGVTHLYLVSGRGVLQADAVADCIGIFHLYGQAGIDIFRIRSP